MATVTIDFFKCAIRTISTVSCQLTKLSLVALEKFKSVLTEDGLIKSLDFFLDLIYMIHVMLFLTTCSK